LTKLEDLKPNATVRGVLPDGPVTVVSVKWFGTNAIELTFKDGENKLASGLLYRTNESDLSTEEEGRPWCFDADGTQFRLVSEANRIHLAHLFDPVLAVHTSIVEPLPHQITAVYEEMLPRQPLRFLLADDPGAGKTIMAGLLIKELIARGDLKRCLVVCPGSLAEQWQDELYRRFHLDFDILTKDNLEAARTGNWFAENNLVIARLDKLSRNEDIQMKLQDPDAWWDLIVCDEAHKMSASHFGGEIKYTKRYQLGQLLSRITRHFLLMTATPHNGKEDDFQLFMALIDGDRFEGRFRDGVHTADVSDLMRRMVKENLLTFDATPLFPERHAYTVPYKLSDAEAELYAQVTEYVREEFNRAEALQNDRRAGTIGFALTILQRRLASSPEAIYQSLRRRKERLEQRMREFELLQRGGEAAGTLATDIPAFTLEDEEDLEDAPDVEVEQVEEQILDRATAAMSIFELKTEIATLARLEAMAQSLRRSGLDKKWNSLAQLLGEIFTPAALVNVVAETRAQYGSTPPQSSPRQKLVIFTEHRDTLTYLVDRIRTLIGRPEAIVYIHGGMGRKERLNAQEAFRNDPEVRVLVATDAAGEGINLQRAHLMVNYDLPWNPNRLEQRFGRIHRIGQTEVCHLWNLIAAETREGEVYRTLLEKLEEARGALGGQVFDVLGKVVFDGKSLRELLVDAIRYGELPETQAKLTKIIENAFDREKLQELIEEKAIAPNTMDASRVYKIRETMERADARKLQPHYIESFFLEAFKQLGGTYRQRENRRYEITKVPAAIRNRDRLIGTGESVLSRYERIVFEKKLISPPGQILAEFVCPGHPLLDATLDLELERHRDLLKRGAVLVDESDFGTTPRILFYLEHAIRDGSITSNGDRRVISKRILYVEIDHQSNIRHINYAPYLDYRPLGEGEPGVEEFLAIPDMQWISKDLEQVAVAHVIETVVPEHLCEISKQRVELIEKTEAAVKDRLTKEINYWDHRSEDLKLQEQSGKPNARLNSNEARKRADELQGRLERRMDELQKERQIAPLPPVVIGGLLVIPIGLIDQVRGKTASVSASRDTQEAAAKARNIIMQIERDLGFEPKDVEFDRLGYDIESRIPGTGKLRFIEVKGRVAGADTVTVTRNEILYSLNKPEDYILAVVAFGGDDHSVHYIRTPFGTEPDFGVTSVNYNLAELLARSEEPK